MSIVSQDGVRVELDRGPSGEVMAALAAIGTTRTGRKHFHVWRLRMQEQWSAREIAELTGLDEGHVRRIVRQLDATLRQILL